MNIIKNFFIFEKNNDKIKFEVVKVKHGDINCNGYLFNQIGYVSDCSSISESTGRPFSLSIDIKRFECAIKYVFLFN